ncbi:CRISPR-associated helicase Cas3' [Pelagicoccus sp. SDUM812003]|uniref:CRISPR-associated helicase Cas3' n=1 Tax=Pelagicoccus sp. SDUM812003 TaxID=3041267 RepID=UPI00280E6034|nr:CRISPR-associated helicase Cas3' [Pelagicoccus sp. SDUM812003]MDQ8201756.1 CRISPR-associated helicase Cas3' [Pelagicoccus sp. SDUM812003]
MFPPQFYAHTAEGPTGAPLPKNSWQPLSVHLQNVAKLAAGFAAPFGARYEAYICGLLHDLGKYQPDFQTYLEHGTPRTPHAIHGAALLQQFPTLSNVIASHHAGLHDFSDEFEAKLIEVREAGILPKLQEAYLNDGLPKPPKPQATLRDKIGSPSLDLHLRLLLSALADADFLDTDQHFRETKDNSRPEPKHDGIDRLLEKLNQQIVSFAEAPDPSSLNQLRTRIAKRCLAAGEENSPGIFSLTVPTGGGKTIASAAFALAHAARHGFKRVIYVIPFTSIIEQNARVFAKLFGSHNVLEHHSLADWQKDDDQDEPTSSVATRARLAAENWDAPFIVTTNVQFFESLHGYRPSALRKLHRLMNSVVLFDECQTFPPELLDPSLKTLNALTDYGKTSLVFCTATQPAFQRRKFFDAGLPEITEIIPDDKSWRLHERSEFKRTRIRFSDQEIGMPDFARRVSQTNRALAIVNTRRSARELFEAIKAESADSGLYHLSTYMCPAHRQDVLDVIRIRLSDNDTACLVVSTQLIEAGVDLDFPKVFRALGPLDAILQAAGRCNREGKLTDSFGNPKLGEVEVVNLAGATLPPGVYRQATALAKKYLPQGGGGEITPKAIRSYFRDLYHDTDRDTKNIVGMSASRLHRTIGQSYKWIDEDEPTESVLTDYNEEAKAWIGELESREYEPLTRYERRSIAPLCINLRASEAAKGIDKGKLRKLSNGLHITQSYHPRFGYNPDGVLLDEHSIL